MKTRTFIAIAVGFVVLAVLLGLSAIAVLSVPALDARAAYALPIALGASVMVTPVIAWLIAPRLRLRYWQDTRDRAGQ